MSTIIQSIRDDPDSWSGTWQWNQDGLGAWAIRYTCAAVIWITILVITGPWAIVAYLGLGWWLGRKVWREAMWLEAGDGVDLTAHAETCLIMTWLWSHPILIAAAWFARKD